MENVEKSQNKSVHPPAIHIQINLTKKKLILKY